MYSVTKQFLVNQFTRLIHDRSGATMVEYGLLVATLSIAILLTVGSIGETVRDDIFQVISNVMLTGANEAAQN
ncbi:Flp family type IVb pilin [Roseibium alexandrii]|jgi:Flp pilus assembly pilin Flp|uniref:Flp pilus assembly protein, pilin Flp n=2 Tax=Roseibium alexandrii TaxID=388408 RepID=A0A0M7ARC9_9HYPH|nr:Flp family type IVb pilin [Roseibium alexandrii]EEE45263.1 Flp pilus assembly protein, pilin Flp [Roseibium alexandrii DFL-11]CTQ77207.1 Flp pilus assembly protein, pilin Flp [Roseibium alexandrii]